MKVLKARNEGDDQESRIRQLTPVLKKARYKIGDSTRKPSHKQAKSSTGSWKANECLKLEAPEMAKLKKPLLNNLPSNAQLVSNFWEVQKTCCRRGPEWLSFLDKYPQYVFFSCRKWTSIVWGFSWLLRTRWKKSSKWVICWSTCRVPHHAATATECDKKTKRACQLLKFWIYVLDREINIF